MYDLTVESQKKMVQKLSLGKFTLKRF